MNLRKILVIAIVLFTHIDCFSQRPINPIHRRRHAVVTLTCEGIDSMVVYIGRFKSYDFQSSGNCVRVNKGETYTKNDTCRVLNFCNTTLSTDSCDFLTLKGNERLKIRVLPREGVHVSKRQKLLICLTINGEDRQVYSKWHKSRFKFLGRFFGTLYAPEYVVL